MEIFILGGLLIFFSIISVYTRLEMHGRKEHLIPIRALIIIHQVSGYLFALSYVTLVALMIIEYIKSPNPPSKIAIHAVLGMTIFPLLAVKIVSARYFKLFGMQFLLYLGVLLWALTFTTYFMMLWH